VIARMMFVELGNELTVPAGMPAPMLSSTTGLSEVVVAADVGAREVVEKLVTPEVVVEPDVVATGESGRLLVDGKLVTPALVVVDPIGLDVELALFVKVVDISPSLDVKLVALLLVVASDAMLDDMTVV